MASYMPMNTPRAIKHLLNVLRSLLLDSLRFLFLTLQSSMELRAENPFLRKQLAFYGGRKIKPRRVNDESCGWCLFFDGLRNHITGPKILSPVCIFGFGAPMIQLAPFSGDTLKTGAM